MERDVKSNIGLAIQYERDKDYYKWHDLLKNPEDVPEVGKYIIYKYVPYEDRTRSGYDAQKVQDWLVSCMLEQNDDYAQYIAWRYFDEY